MTQSEREQAISCLRFIIEFAGDGGMTICTDKEYELMEQFLTEYSSMHQEIENTNNDDIVIAEEATEEEKGILDQIDLTKELKVADEVELILGDYEFVLKEDKPYFVKKKPKYPKTYFECCEIMNVSIPYVETLDDKNYRVDGYKRNIIFALQKLLICRDAYWKIGGEQMGLGKPWEPDFTNDDEERYGIYTAANKVVKDFCGVGDVNTILTFPTEEMRDAFYENFKDLIEQCKELL